MKTALRIITAIVIGLSPLARGQVAPQTVPVPDQPSLTPSTAPPAAGQEGQALVRVPVTEANNAYANGVAGVSSGGGYGGYSYWSPAYSDGDAAVSVISFQESDQKMADEMAEDLNILSLILSQHLERAVAESSDYKLGIPIVLKTSGHTVSASYIEGFGALFNLKVRFPLVAPQTVNREKETTATGSEWEEARHALRGDAEPVSRSWLRQRESEPYDPKMVETLRKRAIELLRNASNLRHVKSDEWIVVNFFGPPAASGADRAVGRPRTSSAPVPKGNLSKEEENLLKMAESQRARALDYEAQQARRYPAPKTPGSSAAKEPPDARFNADEQNKLALEYEVNAHRGAPADRVIRNDLDRSTVMTIRIKKGNADALRANKMSEEEFAQMAEVSSYLAPVAMFNRTSTAVRGL